MRTYQEYEVWIFMFCAWGIGAACASLVILFMGG